MLEVIWTNETYFGNSTIKAAVRFLLRIGASHLMLGDPKTPQLHTNMCLAGIFRHAYKICDSSLIRVRHLALLLLILRCLTYVNL